MKASERITLLYIAGLAGAAGVSYYRGHRNRELLIDTAIHGAVAGTALNVSAWLMMDDAEPGPQQSLFNPLFSGFALANKATDMGKMGKKAIELLTEVEDKMYSDFKENGVKVALIPANPSMVNQDAT
jgi:hypothetical protein